MPRALKNLDITLGLAVIPVQLFTTTSSQSVAFHLLHDRCGSRIQMCLAASRGLSSGPYSPFGMDQAPASFDDQKGPPG
jgi:hypothetical protein